MGTTEWSTPVLFTPNLGLAFAGNERVVAWGIIGQAPVVWEAPSGKKLSVVPDHTSGINSIAFAAGGKEIVTAGIDGKVMRWDTATGKPIGEVALRGGRGGLIYGRFAVALSPDGTRALSAASSPASLFDLTTGAEILAVPSGQNIGFAVQTVPSSDMTKALVISTTYDQKKTGTCVAWDLVAQKKIGEVTVPGGQPPRVAITPSGERSSWPATDLRRGPANRLSWSPGGT